jgi:hypothetical protein
MATGVKHEFYGVVRADVDADLREVRLAVQRGRDPVFMVTLEKCVNWALSRCREKYPNYQIIVQGETYAASA